jgi:hypothetical protein
MLLRQKQADALLQSQHQLQWLHGPAGMGKSCLVAGALQSQTQPYAWYRLDDSDTDPALFFELLNQALIRAFVLDPRLPSFTEANLSQPAVFVARWCRRLAEVLPEVGWLVLDDVQTLITLPWFVELLLALRANCAGLGLVCLSRQAPPAALSRLQMEGGLRMQGQLSMSLLECNELALMHGLSPQDGAVLHETTGGWPALLSLQLRRPPQHWPRLGDASEKGHLFDYLSSQVFAQLPKPVRQVLEAIAGISTVTPAMAVALAEKAEAAKYLEQLAQQRLLVEHRDDGSFRLHPLLNRYLLSYSAVRHTASQRTAQVLRQYGFFEEALSIYLSTQSWPLAEALLAEKGEAWLEQGRYLTLYRLLEPLGEATRQQQPWLGYWSARAWTVVDMTEALRQLRQTRQRFRQHQQGTGFWTAWCAEALILQTRFGEGQAAAELLAESHGVTLPKNPQLVHFWQHVLARHQAGSQAPLLAALPQLEAALTTTRASQNPNLRAEMTASLALIRLSSLAQPHEAARVLALFPSLYEAKLDPLARLALYRAQAEVHLRCADPATTLALIDEALHHAEANGVTVYHLRLQRLAVYASLQAGDATEAEARFQALRPFFQADQAEHVWLDQFLQALVKADSASKAQRRLWVQACHRDACNPYQRHLSHLLEASLAWQSGDDLSLKQALAAVNPDHFPAEKPWWQWLCLEAGVISIHSPAADDWLHTIQQQRRWWCFWPPERVAHWLNQRLPHPLALRWIQESRLPLPERPHPEWPRPWQLKLSTSYLLLHEGQPVVQGALQARTKPWELLAFLACQPATAAAIEDAFWPEADGDRARAALKQTVHRLRQLTEASVVLFEGGLYRLNPELIQVSFDPQQLLSDQFYDWLPQMRRRVRSRV